MIERISKTEIIETALRDLNEARHSVLGTRLLEDGKDSVEYEQKIIELQGQDIQITRKVFSRKGMKNTIDVRLHAFLRMLLIDGKVLFFGIPLGEDYQLHRTTDLGLVEAYRRYFEALP